MARSRARKASWVRSLGYDALQNPSCRQAPFGLGRVDREGEQSWWAREEPAWEATKVRVNNDLSLSAPLLGGRVKIHESTPTRAIEADGARTAPRPAHENQRGRSRDKTLAVEITTKNCPAERYTRRTFSSNSTVRTKATLKPSRLAASSGTSKTRSNYGRLKPWFPHRLVGPTGCSCRLHVFHDRGIRQILLGQISDGLFAAPKQVRRQAFAKPCEKRKDQFQRVARGDSTTFGDTGG